MKRTLTVVAAPALLLVLACASRTTAESGGDDGIEPTGCATLVHDGDFEARSDAELEALRGVTEVTGHLYISEGVTSLEPASCVRGVGTMLAISDTKSLTSLHGLEAFESATIIHINGNDLLETTAGLGVREVSSYVDVSSNHALTDLSFDNLETAGVIALGECAWGEPDDPPYVGNNGLAELNGFPSLTESITFGVSGHTALVSVQGLLQENADVFKYAFFQANPNLDAAAIRAAWEAAGKPADFLTTCGNLGDTEACAPCPPPP